jgi:hypothetical protein
VNEFKYTGIANDLGGVEAHHYESTQWVLGVWTQNPPEDTLLQGSLENMRGEHYQFTVHENLYVDYARVLDSEYNGLGKRYDEDDRFVPKYILTKLKELAKSKLDNVDSA